MRTKQSKVLDAMIYEDIDGSFMDAVERADALANEFRDIGFAHLDVTISTHRADEKTKKRPAGYEVVLIASGHIADKPRWIDDDESDEAVPTPETGDHPPAVPVDAGDTISTEAELKG